MGDITLEILKSIFSEPRILPYLDKEMNANQVLQKYNSNVLISEAMIPTLHYLEICLRNKIDQALKMHYSKTWIIDSLDQLKIGEKDKQKIEAIKLKIFRENKKEATHDDVIAQMTFGFWFSFFHKRYDPIIWQKKDVFKTVFPNLCRANRKRSFIECKILDIKNIRNRIAHHEPIFNYKIPIFQIYELCHQLIEAMSYDAIDMLKKIDRFPAVYKLVREREFK